MKRNLVLIILMTTILSCQDTKKQIPQVDPEFTNYISGFTSGVISVTSKPTLRLMEEIPQSVREDLTDQTLFEFKPEIKGNYIWLNNRTIEFQPEEILPPGTVYNAKFHLYKLIDVPDHLRTLEFQFQTMQQAVYVSFEGLKSLDEYNLQWQQLTGSLKTADYADIESVEKVLVAFQNNKRLKINWYHNMDGNVHGFSADSIYRSEEKEEITLRWDGQAIGSEDKGEEVIEIPALGDFKLMNFQVIQQPDQYVSLYFSDPVNRNQDVRGLIYYESGEDVKLEVNGSQVNVFTATRLQGTHNLVIEESLKNSLDYHLVEKYRNEILFTNIKPNVELIGDGNILPGSNGLIFPFRAVNLKAVDVRIIKIYEDNVAQFLQVNQFDEDREMSRVGRIIYKQELQLTSEKPIDYGNWNIFSLDLSNLINAEPGAIYNVTISFDRSQSLYHCPGEPQAEDDIIPYREDQESELYDGPSNFGYYYYYPDYGHYDWQERDNPCTDSYYYYKRMTEPVTRNILATDLGIIAKRGEGTDLFIAVTDLITTEPLSGVQTEVYDFQNQLMAEEITDSKGMAQIPLDRKPFLLVARNGSQRGYLRLDDGSALSLSMFDVGGSKNIEGIKGFLYGERGVWRPGDSIYMTFVLEDKKQTIPENHPVRFELYTPENQLYLNKVRTASLNGMYDFRTATGGDAPTGNWLAKVIVGGSSFTKTVRIETVKPNRLKLNIDFGSELLHRGTVTGNLNAIWLHGAIARDLNADIEMNLAPARTTFNEYTDYIFDDPVKSFETEDQMIWEGNLDSQGNAKFYTGINVGSEAPGMLQAFFKTRVFENSGNFSIDRFSILYSPYSSYVGVKIPQGPGWNGSLYSNEPNLIPIVTVDESGNPVDLENLLVEIYDVNWRWWWDRDDYDDLATYVRNRSRNLIKSDTISTVNGNAIYEMRFDDNLWGRKLIRITDPEGGHSTGATFYLSYKGWWSSPGQDNPGGAEMLSFTTDKKDYEAGQEIRVDLPDFQDGRALISIENGSQILETFWKEAPQNGQLTIQATEEMAPNAYINVSLIQPHNRANNDLPVRLYGIQNVNVVDPNTILQPVLKMPEELQPEQEVIFNISEENGRRMTYTVAVVDEGLLDLTRFNTPDLWRSFYSKEALGIHTWDMYKYVLGAYTGEMAGLLSIGGDEFIKQDDIVNMNRFVPVVKFFGPFELKEGKSNRHVYTMPNYVGSVKTMVVASHKGAYGKTEKVTPVRKPLMVLATLPRTVSPSETVKLPVTVFSMDSQVRNVEVEVKTNSMFSVEGPSSQKITFDQAGDKIVEFTLKVSENIGAGKVEVYARSGSHEASDLVNLKVRIPNPRISRIIQGMVEPRRTWNAEYNPVGLAGTNNGVLEVSSVPQINLEHRLKFLMQYPHGCIEQTTSSVFPQLFLSRFIELDAEQKNRIQDNITAGINRIKSFQISNGGLTYWPGPYFTADEWGTSYAGHFLLEARELGYQLPIGLIDNWIKYQSQKANSWDRESGYINTMRGNEINQAYRLYTLALAKKPAIGAMNRMREIKDLSVAARWRLAGAYLLAGQSEVAENIVSGLTTSVEYYRELSYTYGSSLRDQAMILEIMDLMDDRLMAKKLVDELAGKIGTREWYSTQTTAFVLMAIGKFLGESDGAAGVEFECTINGERKAVSSGSPVYQQELPFDPANGGEIALINSGQQTLYINIQLDGIPLEENVTDEESDLHMGIRYLGMDGSVIDPAEIEQGTDFMAEIRLSHPGTRADYREMALTQLFPSGWEIRNIRMDNIDPLELQDSPKYQDIRDDRVYSYFDLERRETKTFIVMLNAAYLGDFFLPAVHCEAMYDNTIHATKAGKWVRVVNQK